MELAQELAVTIQEKKQVEERKMITLSLRRELRKKQKEAYGKLFEKEIYVVFIDSRKIKKFQKKNPIFQRMIRPEKKARRLQRKVFFQR